jgi:hypothetical protein
MKLTKQQALFNELDSLDNFEKVSVRSLLLKIWENDDFFANRSFDVTIINVKRMLPNKVFTRQQGFIVRTT